MQKYYLAHYVVANTGLIHKFLVLHTVDRKGKWRPAIPVEVVPVNLDHPVRGVIPFRLSEAALQLAWWNAQECGGFDLTEVWGVDTEIALDMLRVFALVAEHHRYPDNIGYGRQLEAIARDRRPTTANRDLTTAAEER
jgi:hypothetical protein